MRHKLVDDVNVNVKVDIPTQDIEDVIDKVVDAAITLTVVFTAAQIFKSYFKA
jgi:hypothetical protein